MGRVSLPVLVFCRDGMITANDGKVSGKTELGGVRKWIFGSGKRSSAAGALLPTEESVKCNAAKADNNTEIFEERHFAVKPRGTITQFLRRRLVSGRSATNDRSNP